jgi:hypothetical protein
MKLMKIAVAAVLLSSAAYAGEIRLAMKDTKPPVQQPKRAQPKQQAPKQVNRKHSKGQTPAQAQLDYPQLG